MRRRVTCLLAALACGGCNAILGIEDPPAFDGGGGAASSGGPASSGSGAGAATGSASTSSSPTASGGGGGGGAGGAPTCRPIEEGIVIVETDVYVPGRSRRVGETAIDAYVLFDASSNGGTIAQVLYSALDSGAVTQCAIDGTGTANDDSRGFLADYDGETHYVPEGEPHLLTVPTEQCSGFTDRDTFTAHVGAAVFEDRLISVDAPTGEIHQLRPSREAPLSGPPSGRSVARDVEIAGDRLLVAYAATESQDGCLGALELTAELQPAICVPGSEGDLRAVAAAVKHDPFVLEVTEDGARVVRILDGSCWQTDHPDAHGFDVDEEYVYIPLTDSLLVCALDGERGCLRLAVGPDAGEVSDVRVTPVGAFFAQDLDDGTGLFARIVADELFAE